MKATWKTFLGKGEEEKGIKETGIAIINILPTFKKKLILHLPWKEERKADVRTAWRLQVIISLGRKVTHTMYMDCKKL